MKFTYERYRFNGDFWQPLCTFKYDTKEKAEEAEKKDREYGIKTYGVHEVKP